MGIIAIPPTTEVRWFPRDEYHEDQEELRWCPIIDVDSGIVVNWDKGTTLDCYYKTSDECAFEYEQEGAKIMSYKYYVPDFLSIEGKGYGDYIIIKIDEEGRIHNWDSDGFYKFLTLLAARPQQPSKPQRTNSVLALPSLH